MVYSKDDAARGGQLRKSCRFWPRRCSLLWACLQRARGSWSRKAAAREPRRPRRSQQINRIRLKSFLRQLSLKERNCAPMTRCGNFATRFGAQTALANADWPTALWSWW